MASKSFCFHYLKKKTLNIFSYLSSSNVHPINAHTKANTFHKSLNNFKLKPSLCLENLDILFNGSDEKRKKGKILFSD
jgi:hypothetical protein